MSNFRPPSARRIFYVDKTGNFPVLRTGELGDRVAQHPPAYTSGGMKGMLDRMRLKQQAMKGK